MNIGKYLIFFLTTFFVHSCSMTRNLPDGVMLHTRTEVKFKQDSLINDKGQLESDLLSLAVPKPTGKTGKWRVSLYNKIEKKKAAASKPKEKGFRHWLQVKIGRPPVLYSQPKVNRSQALFEKYLQDNGYFGAQVLVDTAVSRRKVSVEYTVSTKGQYKIRTVSLPGDSTKLGSFILQNRDKLALKSGTYFKQSTLAAERVNLMVLANDNGFMNVNQDHFYYFVDTTATGLRQADIHLRIRNSTDSSALEIFRLNKARVYANYSLSEPEAQGDTVRIDHFLIFQKNKLIKPKLLKKIIGCKAGELFSKTRQDAVISRLLDLGIYKFINLKFEKIRTDTTFLFNHYFYLTPVLMQDVAAEFQANTRSGNYLGTAASFNYAHKNLFHGAERLDLSLSGGIETQLSNSNQLINTIDIGAQASLSVPKLLVPFFKFERNGVSIPKTRISVGDNFQRRLEYYSINSFNFKYGFEWAPTKRQRHQLYPLNINQIFVFGKTQALFDLFDTNPRLERSFDDVFILGLTYQYTYSSQSPNLRKPYAYFRGGFESSGDIPYLIASTLNSNGSKPYGLFGTPFSQFLRLDGDFRYYIPVRKALIASRLIAGIGIPYQNSDVLPYIKQYSIGGSGSLRAFPFRGLGPGSYQPVDTEVSDFIDQTGDLKLEFNLEYRFPIIPYLKGAVFVDAGNIWLLEDEGDSRPEGLFKFNTFYKEIAVGTGVGLRIDLSFLVIRFDGSFALRKPFLDDGKRWVLSDIKLSSPDWRKENLVWNLAIGYPF